MDQNRNAQGQPNWNEKKSQQAPNQDQPSSPPKTDRDPAPGVPDETRGARTEGEKNSSGISNRGMSESEEQADLPSRGSGRQSSSDTSDQSER
jgi:hypothetical protein